MIMLGKMLGKNTPGARIRPIDQRQSFRLS